MTNGGVAQRLIRFYIASVGHLPGSLAIAGVFACYRRDDWNDRYRRYGTGREAGWGLFLTVTIMGGIYGGALYTHRSRSRRRCSWRRRWSAELSRAAIGIAARLQPFFAPAQAAESDRLLQ